MSIFQLSILIFVIVIFSSETEGRLTFSRKELYNEICNELSQIPTSTEIPEVSTPEKPIDFHPVKGHSPVFPPYYDVNLKGAPKLKEVYEKSGQKDFTLAFALGGHAGCEPKWGAENDIDDPEIISQIRYIQSQGGQVIVATGGAVGPYLEHQCSSVSALLGAYKKILDAVQTNHLDIDVEAPINADVVNKALAALQKERPFVTVSYTMPVQGDDYGLTDALGTQILKSAKDNGVNVHIVNAMAMEYPSRHANWGDSVIDTGKAVLGQMRTIWPEKSEGALKKMLGLTVMLGRNFNSRIFDVNHGRQLVSWGNENHIGLISFWSVGRDNGGCNGGGVSPSCSSISQSLFEFIKVFQGFKG